MPSPALNRVPAPEALDDEVEALVARIVAKPRVAIALGRALFYRQLEQGIVSAYEDAGATMAYDMMDLGARGRAGLHREADAELGRGPA